MACLVAPRDDEKPDKNLMSSDAAIVVINCGSSSLKFAIFASERTLPRMFSGAVERIGLRQSRFHVEDGDGTSVGCDREHR
jgi:acetate kinase